MKKIELEPGQIWQVPDKKWIRVRTIMRIVGIDYPPTKVCYHKLGDFRKSWALKKDFLRWIRRNKAKLIGIKDFDTGKAKVVK